MGGTGHVMSRTATLLARIERLPPSRYTWTLIFLLSLGAFFEIYDLMMTAYVSPGLILAGIFSEGHEAAFGLSDQAAFAAATFAGLFVGTIVFGSVADRFGRRAIFTYALLWYAAATLVMGLQSTAGGIFLWRFTAGLGLGVEMITIDAFIAELVNRHIRGKAFAFNQGVMFCAVPAVAVLSWALTPRAPLGIQGWRWVVFFPVLAALVVWWIRRNLPESPRWLAQHGRLSEAEAVVTRMEAEIEKELGRPLSRADEADYPGAGEIDGHGSLRDLFQPAYRKRTLLLAVFNFFQTIGFYGFGNWVPRLVSNQGVPITESLQYSAIIAFAYPVGPFVFTLFADRFERKWQTVAAALATASFGLIFTATREPWAIITLGIAITLSNNLLSYSYHAYQAEVFPTSIRTRAIGFVYSFSRLSTIFTSFMIAYFSIRFGNGGVFAFIAVSMVIAASAIGGCPPTRGLTLERISRRATPHATTDTGV
jgi:MFS transporter, putative metabolite:H+ symporter